MQILFLFIFFYPAVCAHADSKLWIQRLESLSDLEVSSSNQAESAVQCTALASSLSEVQLVTYNSSTGVCSLYKCRLSLTDCRKCRSIANSNNQLAWIQNVKADKCWTTIQHRVSNSVNFVRPWADYKAGFGEGPDGNYWIGLDTIRSLTSVTGGCKLRFLMKAWNGTETWAQYSSFSVGPETDWFRLNVFGFSSSQPAVGDSFGWTNGSKFSTSDADNDGAAANCALNYNGAWWFKTCNRMHANGLYYSYPTAINSPSGQGITWIDGYGYRYSLMEIEMQII